jgi:arabinofuranosyltransferase
LAGADLLWRGRHAVKATARTLVFYALGGLLSGLPYFGFNYFLSGGILPTTFSAKGNYYAGVEVLGYLRDAFTTLIVFSPLVALVPGFLVAVASRKTDWRPLVWVILLLGLYAWRLPVTYHHARYLMPLIPFLVIYGVIGTEQIRDWLRTRKLPVVARAVPLLVGAVLLVSWLNNTGAYREDVRYINDQHVAVGNWLAQNTPPQALVATHDVGAITFFGRRRLLDTAGLVSPEFAPIVRDEAAILQKVQERGATYFVFLPTWYGSMERRLANFPKVFEAQADYLARFGERNMVIYGLR